MMNDGPGCSGRDKGSTGFGVRRGRSLDREVDNGSFLISERSAPTSNPCAISLSEGSSSISLWSAVDAPSVEILASSQLSPRLALSFCCEFFFRLAILEGCSSRHSADGRVVVKYRDDQHRSIIMGIRRICPQQQRNKILQDKGGNATVFGVGGWSEGRHHSFIL